MHYLLFYELVDDYLDRRTKFRAAHLGMAKKAFERGEIVLAGALEDPADEAVLVFNSSGAAEGFANADPYVKNGLVASWRIRKWNTVIGEGTSLP